MTFKPENRRFVMDELAIYAVQDGNIVHEQFFFDTQMKLDRALAVGSTGGHGPIRYTVEAYSSSEAIRFRFGGPVVIAPTDIDDAVRAVENAGGKITKRGDFCPGEPYVFFLDPDGNEVEIWFEIPTPLDPQPEPA